MPEDSPTFLDTVADESVTDPLTEVTRRERRALLGSCVLGLAISAGGLVPERIETFGVSITPTQEDSLLYILGGVILYLLCGFIVYAWSDIQRREARALAARERIRPVVQAAVATAEATKEKVKSGDVSSAEQVVNNADLEQLSAFSNQAKRARRVERAGAIRVVFDVLLPVVVAIAALVAVWSSTGGFPGWGPVGVGAGTTAATVTLLALIWRRRDLYKWWRRRRRDLRDARRKRILKKADSLPAGHPKKKQLTEKAMKLFVRHLKDISDGII